MKGQSVTWFRKPSATPQRAIRNAHYTQERSARGATMVPKKILQEEEKTMTPLQLNLLILAVGASKMAFALVFLHWINTRKAQPQAQAIGSNVQNQKPLKRVLS